MKVRLMVFFFFNLVINENYILFMLGTFSDHMFRLRKSTLKKKIVLIRSLKYVF